MHNKNEIKGIVCGDEEFFKDLKENFQKKIFINKKKRYLIIMVGFGILI